MSRLLVVEARGPDALESLRPEWQELFREAETASAFLSWEWIRSWHARLGPSIIPRIFCARSNGALVGLLPLGEARGRGRLTRSVRLLSFLGERFVGGDYLDVLARPAAGEDAARAIFEYLAQEASFDVLQLDGVAGDSPTLALLAWRFAEDKAYEHNVTPYEICPYLRLAGTGEETILASRRPHEFRRKLRQLTALAGFQTCVITEPNEVPAALERFFALHDRRWAQQGGSDAMARPAVKAFHREVVPRLAHANAIRFEEIWAEGKCVASLYGIDRKERFFFYQCGYDPDWARRSVGFVRLGLSIADAADRGVRVYDFLRGSEAYKFDWANAARSTLAVRISRRTAAGRSFVAGENLRAAAKLTAKAVLPTRAVELLRRQRRRSQRGEHREVPAGAELPRGKP
jgi:CelD/BcsL family acetyltransferase involved in cellulose biosynthesis